MSAFNIFILLAVSGVSLAQRGSYAGRRPIGYPEYATAATTTTTSSPLGNRFGEGITTTTARLPIEALGDRELVERLSKLPIDEQPFWLINWKALEDNRRNPQTFQPNPISFTDPVANQNAQPIVQTQNRAAGGSTNIRASDFGIGQRTNAISSGAHFTPNGQLVVPNAQTNSFSGNSNFGQVQTTNRSGQLVASDFKPVNRWDTSKHFGFK